MVDPNHLLSVKGSENSRKSDKGPDGYLPPKEAFRCEYVRTWVRIKADWELNMTDEESRVVTRILARCQ
jgi:hypothetical protein